MNRLLISRIRVNKLLDILLSLLIFVVVVDPTNTLFKLKEALFGFFFIIAICNQIYDKSFKKHLLFVIGIFFFLFFSIVWGNFIMSSFVIEDTLSLSKSLLFFLILLFVGDGRYHFFEKLLFPCILICVISIVIYVIFDSEAGSAIYQYLQSKNNPIMMARRSFLNLEITSVYYKSSPILVIVLAYYFYQYLFSTNKKVWCLLVSILFFVTLLCSGTRANMFSAILIVVMLVIYKIKSIRHFEIVYFVLLLFFLFGAFAFTLRMLQEKDENSVQIKSAHLASIMNMWEERPELLIGGQGVGSLYYSEGAGMDITVSELSYIELIRMYGLVGGTYFMFILFYPLLLMLNKKEKDVFAMGLGYFSYLCIGGTNPLLISSTGILALAVIYSYVYKRY